MERSVGGLTLKPRRLGFICEVKQSADFLRDIRTKATSYTLMFTAAFNSNFSGKSTQLLYLSDS
jgi:hypothetical protein